MESTLLTKNMDSAFALENEDLRQKILSRLPARSFASAACVSKSWNQACNQILCRPKLASALSLSSSLHVAIKEVLDKVLSEPIRPHFAIACVGSNFNLAVTQRLLIEKLGSRIPIITHVAAGIIGMQAHTNRIKEVNWELLRNDASNDGGIYNFVSQSNDCGIVLVVGFVPGLKVDTIPLLRSKRKSQEPKMEVTDKFLMDIKEYTASVSNSTSPDGIIMFGDQRVDLKPVLVQMGEYNATYNLLRDADLIYYIGERLNVEFVTFLHLLDNHFPKETVIVGDASGTFLFKGVDDSRNYVGNADSFDAVALVFAKDSSSSDVRGNIQFHLTLSSGLLPFGPQLKVVSVTVKKANCSWLTAKIEGHPEILESWGLLEDIYEEIEDENPKFYIGVTHQKTGSQQLGSSSYIAFYEVLGDADKYYFVVDGVGIKPGDSFVFYHSDSETAFSTSFNAYQDLGILKTTASTTPHDSTIINYGPDKKEIIGGLIFSCCCRGEESLPGCDVTESLPFSTNYPGIPLAGVFCDGEIARISTSLITLDDEDDVDDDDKDKESYGGCFLHHYSTAYLVMSYTVPSQR